MKKIWFIALILLMTAALFADEAEDSEKKQVDLDQIAEDIVDGVKSLDLDRPDDDKLRAGLELGWPTSGLTVGYHFTPAMEGNVVLGIMNFNSLALGGSLLFTVLNLEAQDEIIPVNLGPVVYTSFNPDSIGFSAGALARAEYDFQFPLNVFIQAGCVLDFVAMSNEEFFFGFPFAIGARYIF